MTISIWHSVTCCVVNGMPKETLELSLIRVFQIVLSSSWGRKFSPLLGGTGNFTWNEFFYLVVGNWWVLHWPFKPFSKQRSSRPEVFCKKGVLRNFAKFTEKHLCQILFFSKVETLAQVFSCEFCEVSKNTWSFRTHSVAASKSKKQQSVNIY